MKVRNADRRANPTSPNITDSWSSPASVASLELACSCESQIAIPLRSAVPCTSPDTMPYRAKRLKKDDNTLTRCAASGTKCTKGGSSWKARASVCPASSASPSDSFVIFNDAFIHDGNWEGLELHTRNDAPVAKGWYHFELTETRLTQHLYQLSP